ncbi:hypothetical protein CRG98_046795 [Punica granatum]|uniref:Uncharacterized protein n=1 Tax=Punica granatum TaxID=22663 RepID=A0A2I0HM40_PUNGR|nr:hypothetical protein CRG98_046795 [Punica granatum]
MMQMLGFIAGLRISQRAQNPIRTVPTSVCPVVQGGDHEHVRCMRPSRPGIPTLPRDSAAASKVSKPPPLCLAFISIIGSSLPFPLSLGIAISAHASQLIGKSTDELAS